MPCSVLKFSSVFVVPTLDAERLLNEGNEFENSH
jgi:hypothetical protein